MIRIQVSVLFDSIPFKADTTHKGNTANICVQLNPMPLLFHLCGDLSGRLPRTVKVMTVMRIITSNSTGAFLLRHLLVFKYHIH